MEHKTPSSAARHFIVTRHAGARDWIRARVNAAAFTVIEHVESLALNHGDQVYGVLPIDLAVRLQAQGAQCWHLIFRPEKSQRGTELGAEDLDRMHARLVHYEIRAVAETGQPATATATAAAPFATATQLPR